MTTPEPRTVAADLLAANRYAVLATYDGEPWATPVWFTHRDLETILWVSRPTSRHSQALAGTGRVAVTVFDGTVEPGHGTAFYGRGSAHECPDDRLDDLLDVYSTATEQQGLGTWDRGRVTGDAPLRLYVADLDEVSVLLDVEGPEVREPVTPARRR